MSCSFDRNIIIWDVIKGIQLTVLNGHSDLVMRCDLDLSLFVWSNAKRKTITLTLPLTLLFVLPFQVYKCSFSPDGLQVVSYSD